MCLLRYRFPQVIVTAYHGTGLAKVQHLRLSASKQAFIAKAVIAWEQGCPIHRETSSAVVRRASDIHVEPRRDAGTVRFRIDGVLHNVYELPAQVVAAVCSRSCP